MIRARGTHSIWHLLAAALVGCAGMYPQEAPGGETNLPAVSRSYLQRHWTREHGLPSNTIRSMLQTRDGHLWIGTASGLVRFDGRKFTVFDRLTHPAFVSHDCVALAEDAEERLWIGTPEGVMWFHQGRLTRSPVNDVLTNRWILSLCADTAGRVWLGTRQGLYRYQGGECRFEFASEGSASQQFIRCLGEDRSGNIWAGNMAGAFRLKPGASRFELVPPPAPSGTDHVQCFAVGPDGAAILQGARLWRATNDGLALILSEADGMGRFNVNPSWPILADRAGRLWITGSHGGLFQLRENQPFSIPLSGAGDPVRVEALCEDGQGNVWAGTENHGLFSFQARQFRTLTKEDGLPDSESLALIPARDGGIWIGTRFGLTRWHEERANSTPWAGYFDKLRVRSLHESSDGTLWLATDRSLEHIVDGQVTAFPPLPGARMDKVWSITSDAAGNVWAGCVNGLLHWRKGRAQFFTGTDGLPGSDVRVVHLDRLGRLWLATAGGGLAWAIPRQVNESEISPGPMTTIAMTNGLTDDTVRALHEDAEGVIWAGTEHGLNRVELRRNGSTDTLVALHRFTMRDGLPDEMVNGIIGDDFGQLWINCRRGLYRARLSELNEAAQGQARRVNFVAYDEADGMLTSATSGFSSHPPSCKTPDGRLWFATPKGVVVVGPSQFSEPAAPNILLERIVADGQVLLDRTAREPQVQVPPGGLRSLEIDFTAPDFRAPEKVRFQYRLTGNDSDWIDAGTRRVASYTNLKPGRYRFEVLAARHHGLWSRTGAGFSLHLAPHYWQTWWFWTALSLVLTGAATVAVRWRVLQARRLHSLEKEAGVLRERERIARDMHDDIGARLSQLSMLVHLVPETARPPGDGPSPPSLREVVRDAAESLDATVWAVKPDNDTLRHLADYLAEYAHGYLSAASIRLEIDLPAEIPAWPIAADQRHHLFLAAKETLHNAVRHARPNRVLLRVAVEQNCFSIEIADDGCGLPPHLVTNQAGAASEQDGLRNLRRRAESAGADLRIQSAPDQGTRIIFTMPRSTA